MSSSFKFVRAAIYALKRRYPIQLELKRDDQLTINLETGIQTSTVASRTVKRAVLLPNKLARLSAHRGAYDIRDRGILIDRQDLGSFKLDLSTWVMFKMRRYEVKSIVEHEEAECVELVVHAVDGDVAAFDVKESIDVGEGAFRQ